jgi:hypothetical protein
MVTERISRSSLFILRLLLQGFRHFESLSPHRQARGVNPSPWQGEVRVRVETLFAVQDFTLTLP